MSSVVQPFRELTESVLVWYLLSNCKQGFFPSTGGTIAVALALPLFGANWGQCASGKNLTIPKLYTTSGFLECAAALTHWGMTSHGKRWGVNTRWGNLIPTSSPEKHGSEGGLLMRWEVKLGWVWAWEMVWNRNAWFLACLWWLYLPQNKLTGLAQGLVFKAVLLRARCKIHILPSS